LRGLPRWVYLEGCVSLLFGLGLLLLLAIPFGYALRRSNELFVARVRAGKLEVVRGRLPQGLFDDLEDVFARTKADAALRVVVEDRRPHLKIKGADEGTAQRARNVIGRFPLAEIRAGRRVPNRAARRRRRA
jgi:hypothetical protein